MNKRTVILTTAAALALGLTGCTGTNTQTHPSTPAPSSPVASSPATPETSAPASSSASESASPGADPANVKWAAGEQVVPETGPVKLPEPKTEQAALEVTYQLVQRVARESTERMRAKDASVGEMREYVGEQALAQLTSDLKVYAKADWTFEGSPKVERILGLEGSYARSSQAYVDGKPIKAKYGSTWLRYCVDSSGVKFSDEGDSTSSIGTQQRRIFEAQGQYNPVTKQWSLVQDKAVDGPAEKTTC